MEEREKNKKFDFSDPMTIMAVVSAVMADLMTVVFSIALGIPAMGIIFIFFGIAIHYVAAIIIAFIMWSQLRGVLTKIIIILLWLIPLPTLSISILAGILLSNKFIRTVVEQVAIQAIAVATAGAGEALEAGVVAGRAAEAGAQVATRAAQAGTQAAARTAQVRAGQVAERAAISGEQVASRESAGAVENITEKTTSRPRIQQQEVKTPKPQEGPGESLYEKATKKRPEEIAEDVFDKMEEISEDEESENNEQYEEVVDLSRQNINENEENRGF